MARNARRDWFSMNRLLSNRHAQVGRTTGQWSHRRLRFEPLEDRRLLSITVNTLVDETDGSITDGDVSLRDAIAIAPAGQTIDFASSLISGGPASINLTGGELLINKSLTISGPGANLLTIHATDQTPSYYDGSRIFNIDDGTDTARNVAIIGLTLTGGDIGGSGGAITSAETLTVTACSITGNVASSNGGGLNAHGQTTIARTTISDNKAGSAGGGVWSGGTLTVIDSDVDGNFASGSPGALVATGGGIHSGTNLTLSRSRVTENTAGFWAHLYVNAGGHGGGVYASGSLTIAESTISGNNVLYGLAGTGIVPENRYGGIGGGVSHAHGAATITQSEISNNQARWAGGGIAHYGGSLNVADSTISGNRGNFQGGGIYSISGSATPSSTSLSVNRSTISGNSTGSSGGGIWSQGGNFTITNSTISGNTAHSPPAAVTGSWDSGYGGGVYSDNLTSTVSHSTITRNWAGGDRGGNGGGIRTLRKMAITHTILAGNTHGIVPVPDDVDGAVEVSFSLLGVNTFATIINGGGNLIGTAVAPIDPLLGPLADNGGPTQTHALLPDSPAIDAVDPGALAGALGTVVSANLGTGAYSASQWAQFIPGAAPHFAFDGIVASGWDAGNYPVPVQWIEVDLQRAQSVTGFRLYVDQRPAGKTTHQVWVSNSPIHGNLSGATLVHAFSGITADKDVLTFAMSSAVTGRYVQIRTTESPSWVGWDEVEVFAGGIPAYDQRGASFGRVVGGQIDMGAFEVQPDVAPPALPGDFNENGEVDAADYVVWRRTNGQTVAPYSGADGNGDRVVDQADSALWRANFGMKLTGSAGITAADAEPFATVEQSMLANPFASSFGSAEDGQQTPFGWAAARGRDVALAVHNLPPLQSSSRGLPHEKPLDIKPSVACDAVRSRNEVLAYSVSAVVGRLLEHDESLRPAKWTVEKEAELYGDAVEAVFAALDTRSMVTGIAQPRKQF